MPSFGFQWNLTKVDLPFALTSRKVWMPKPSIIRSERGMARSDIAHISMWVASGISEAQSQNVSCAVPACGKPRSASIFTAWIRSGNLIASWMKKTGILLPTRSQLPSCGVEFDREAAHVARRIDRAGAAGDGGEAGEDRRLLALALEQVGLGDVGQDS